MITRSEIRRRGLTLMEVLVSLAIFLMSFAAISALVNRGAEVSHESEMEMTGTRLAESIMAEVAAGALPLQGGEGPCDYEPDWSWAVESMADGDVPNLWLVTVRVSRQRWDGSIHEVSLSRMMLDPLVRTHPLPPVEEVPADGAMPAGQ